MSHLQDDSERLAARAEDIISDWYDTVERVPGEDGEPDTIVARDGDQIAAILPLDDESLESLAEADADGDLQSWLREELAEGEASDDNDEAGDEDLDAAADAWLGASGLGAGGLGNRGSEGVPGETPLVDADDDVDDEDDVDQLDDDDDVDQLDDDDDDFDIDDWDDPEADALIDELPA